MSVSEVLKGQVRNKLGTGPSRELRRNGMIPVTIYGDGKEPLSVSLEEKEVTKLYRKHGFTSTVLEIEIDGKKHKVLPKSVELHPTKEFVRHADFLFIPAKGMQKVAVPVVYNNKEKSIGVKKGGFFNIIKRKNFLNCPVDSIPLDIEIDVTNMQVGSSLTTKKITLPEGCSLYSKKDLVLASITGRGGKSSSSDDETAQTAA
jgi:large subunit ribosomal protein L25